MNSMCAECLEMHILKWAEDGLGSLKSLLGCERLQVVKCFLKTLMTLIQLASPR